MDLDRRIFVAGHNGMVGSAIVRALKAQGAKDVVVRTRQELNLLNQADVNDFFSDQRPEYVFLAAAKVGGIYANNTYPADFIAENLGVQTNVISASYANNVKRLLFLGSSCVYPRQCPQPMKEEHLLTGLPEVTNEPYAIAKIAGIKMCQAFNRQHQTDYISVMPTNLYGQNDNFDLKNSHVLPGLLRKVHEAKLSGSSEVVVWGTGTPFREFLLVDDLAEACLYVMGHPAPHDIVNIGSGEEVSIRKLAQTICEVVGFKGALTFDESMPDGTPRKLLDSGRIREMGWKPRLSLEEGISETYEWFLQQEVAAA